MTTARQNNTETPVDTGTTVNTENLTEATPEYTELPYTFKVVPEVLKLLQLTLGNSGAVRKTNDFWQWKHHANPFGVSYGLLAWDEQAEEIASLRVLMRWSFGTRDGKVVQAARAVDTATHPDHQRRGLFLRLTRRAVVELTAEGSGFIFNTPNQKSLPGYLKMGWKEAARWPLYLKPLRPLRMAYRRLRPKPPEAAMAFANQFREGILPWHTFMQRYGDQVENLLTTWERARRQVGLRTVRTVDYLNWRYGGHPHIEYGVYPHTDQGYRLQGFAILRPNGRFGWQETVLTEVCLAQPELSLGVQLMRGLCHNLTSDYLIAHFAEGTLEAELLRRCRFWKVPRQQIIFTVHPLQATTGHITQPNAWDLSLGDLEIF
jgi:hypothetical protein